MTEPADIAVRGPQRREGPRSVRGTELAKLAPTIITAQFAVTAAGRVVRQSWPTHELAEAIRKADPTRAVDRVH